MTASGATTSHRPFFWRYYVPLATLIIIGVALPLVLVIPAQRSRAHGEPDAKVDIGLLIRSRERFASRLRSRGLREQCRRAAERMHGSNRPIGMLATTPRPRHTSAMTATVKLDASNRIVLSKDLRRAAGIPRGQKLTVSATPGRIVLEVQPNSSGRVAKRGKLKVWTGAVPQTPLSEAVEHSRHYRR
jgi:hypothetical protein